MLHSSSQWFGFAAQVLSASTLHVQMDLQTLRQRVAEAEAVALADGGMICVGGC